MFCLNPILAVSIMKNDDDKHVLKFIPRSEIDNLEFRKLVYGSNNVFLLPCMKCKPCRDRYAKDWAVRCTLEAQEHKFNYFLTLTYDDEHVLYANKHDFSQKFLKNLGYELTGKRDRPKFFACMEKGEETNRIHFHCVLFLDKELDLIRPVKIGSFYHYSCELLERCWKNGFVDVAPFESDCARYVAKYSTKQGNCFMSRNLAKSYYLKHRDEIVKDGFFVYGSFFGKEYITIPKVFGKWFIEDDCSDHEAFKLSNQQLTTMLIRQSIRDGRFRKEADWLRSDIYQFLKKDMYAKERMSL